MAILRPAILLAMAIPTGIIAGRRAWYLIGLVRSGQSDASRFRDIPKRVAYEMQKVIGQRKLLQWSGPGTAHALTFWGFLVIQVALVESVGEFFSADFALPVIGHWPVLGAIFDFFVAAVGISLIAFAIIRVKNNPHVLARRSRFYGSHTGPAYVILVMIFGVVATLLLLNASRQGLGTLPYSSGAFLSRPLGNWLASQVSETGLEVMELLLLTFHVGVVFSFLILVLHSKHLHIFTSPLNVLFGRHPLALGRLRPLHIDVETMDENTKLGAAAVEDFSWKHLLDGLTCTECGRCQSVCPAWNTEKPLSPKLLVMGVRDNLFERGPVLTKRFDPESDGCPDPIKAVMQKSLVPDVITDDVLWSCTTCGACVYECPVDIEHVDMIMDMRRNQVMMESRFPREAVVMLNNVESVGNPWGMGDQERTAWMREVEEIPVIQPGQPIPADCEYLFWVGCAGALEDRAKKSTVATARLLKQAGVKFAVLGAAERCTGDPARRIGNEFLFQELAKSNVETLNGAGVRKIIAQCPHCFNTLRNEYPDYGGSYEVVHHSQLLSRMVREGKLQPQTPLDLDVTYHDPCYLARHNDVLSDPRRLITATGARQSEMHRCGRKTFCCGAGGSRMWMEETIGKRVNIERIEEALETNPDVVATGCPFCLVMLDDAIKDKQMRGEGEGVEVMDVSQIFMRSLNGLAKVAQSRMEEGSH